MIKTVINGSKVWVRRIDSKGSEYKAVIRGLAVDWNIQDVISPSTIYIIEMIDKFRFDEYPFDFVTMPASCLDERIED